MRWLAWLLCLPAAGDYPTPAQTGFHHCALIYERATRSPDDLGWYVADVQGWLFDAFLFLSQRSASGASTMDGATSKADWQALLDTWFSPGRDLPALDDAVARAAARLGAPAAPRRVILMIPRPHPDAAGFEPPLSDEAGVRSAVGWYLDTARERFAAAGFRHLELWGGYWMNETIRPNDEPRVQWTADELHQRGLKLAWIPWYRAIGWNRWRDCGIDVAILQPNYAFVSQHLGTIRRNRLAVTAELARGAGMGVEIELPLRLGDALAERHVRDYLVDGARHGYQDAATAHYLGRDHVERCATAADPRLKAIYALLARYVRGERIDEPAQAWRRDGDGWLCELDAPAHVAEVDVFFDEPDDAATWHGTAIVEARSEGAWRPSGWARRGGHVSQDGRHQVLTVPVSAEAEALRVRCPAPAVTELRWHPDSAAPERRHLAYGRPYTSAATTAPKYPDSGGELTDGAVPETGFGSGRTVGWYGVPVTITLDLGRVVLVDLVAVTLQGGGYAAVNWPASGGVLVGLEPPPVDLQRGLGAPPVEGDWQPLGEPVIGRRRSEVDADGRLEVAFAGRPARYVTLTVAPRGWLVLSEIEVFSGGANVALGRPYAVRPWPTAEEADRYPDDGAKLTDGRIAEGFDSGLLVGWSDAAPRQWVVDLGEPRGLSALTAWSLRGGLYGIYAPREVRFEGSLDGAAWLPLGMVAASDEPETGEVAVAAPYRLEAAVQARWLRMTVAPSRGWAMLSELQVEEAPRRAGGGRRRRPAATPR